MVISATQPVYTSKYRIEQLSLTTRACGQYHSAVTIVNGVRCSIRLQPDTEIPLQQAIHERSYYNGILCRTASAEYDSIAVLSLLRAGAEAVKNVPLISVSFGDIFFPSS